MARGAGTISNEEFLLAYNDSTLNKDELLAKLDTDMTAIRVKLRSSKLRALITNHRFKGDEADFVSGIPSTAQALIPPPALVSGIPSTAQALIPPAAPVPGIPEPVIDTVEESPEPSVPPAPLHDVLDETLAETLAGIYGSYGAETFLGLVATTMPSQMGAITAAVAEVMAFDYDCTEHREALGRIRAAIHTGRIRGIQEETAFRPYKILRTALDIKNPGTVTASGNLLAQLSLAGVPPAEDEVEAFEYICDRYGVTAGGDASMVEVLNALAGIVQSRPIDEIQSGGGHFFNVLARASAAARTPDMAGRRAMDWNIARGYYAREQSPWGRPNIELLRIFLTNGELYSADMEDDLKFMARRLPAHAIAILTRKLHSYCMSKDPEAQVSGRTTEGIILSILDGLMEYRKVPEVVPAVSAILESWSSGSIADLISKDPVVGPRMRTIIRDVLSYVDGLRADKAVPATSPKGLDVDGFIRSANQAMGFDIDIAKIWAVFLRDVVDILSAARTGIATEGTGGVTLLPPSGDAITINLRIYNHRYLVSGDNVDDIGAQIVVLAEEAGIAKLYVYDVTRRKDIDSYTELRDGAFFVASQQPHGGR